MSEERSLDEVVADTWPDMVMVRQADLDAMEQRALDLNVKIKGLEMNLRAGHVDSALSLAQIVQEMNWTQRKALIDAGAVDPIEPMRALSSREWDDDQPPIEADKLDLSGLAAAMTGRDDEAS